MEKELAYWITMYKLEGHETWRCHLGRDKEALARQNQNNKEPKITEMNQLKIDRITGQIIPQ